MRILRDPIAISDGNGSQVPANLPASYIDKTGDVSPQNTTPNQTPTTVNPDEDLSGAFDKARSGQDHITSEASVIHKEPVPAAIPLKTTAASPVKPGDAAANAHQAELDANTARAKEAADKAKSGEVEVPAIELDKKVEDKVPTEEPALPEAPAKPADGRLPKQRDYTLFREEDVPALKKLANKDYAVVAPIAAKLKEEAVKLAEATKLIEDNRQGILPPSYLEHEGAVILSPVFNQLQTFQEKASFEKEYWMQQLNQVKQGKSANMLVIDPKTGRYSKGQEMVADVNTETLITDRLQVANQNIQATSSQLQQYVGAFQGQVRQSREVLKKAEDTYFPHFKNPTGHHKELIERVVSALPEVFRDSPMAPMLGKAYATIIELNRQLKDAQKGGNIQAAIASDARRAGPTAGQTGGGGAVGKPKDETDEDLMSAFQKAARPER